MIFCGAGNSTLQLAERAAEAVNKMLSVGAVNWEEEQDDEIKVETANASIEESKTCNTNEAHGTYSSHFDVGNLDVSSIDIFAEKLRVSTKEVANERFGCSLTWCNGREPKTEGGSILDGTMRFVPFELGSVGTNGKENQQNDRSISLSSKVRYQPHPSEYRRQTRKGETNYNERGEQIYPSEIVVYKPKRPWASSGKGKQPPELQISWSVEKNLEMGNIDQWTGCLLRDNVEIGWITMYSISQRINRKPKINDAAVSLFVEHFILPANNPLGAGDETSGRGAQTNGQKRDNTHATNSKQVGGTSLSSEGGGIMTLSRMLAIGPIFLVTDITIQPNHRGVGFGLFLLDGACRRVAESFSLVIVSLREAVDETLKAYIGLLGFTCLDGREDFVGRRNGRHSPCIEEICPYLPTPTGIVAGAQTNAPTQASTKK